MNFSDFALYGSSPLFDNTVLVRCHICQFIVKLSAFIGHLAKRHKITNEQEIEESLVQFNESERLKQEQQVLAVNKSQTNRTSNKKSLKTKQLSVDNLYEKVFQKENANHNSKINNKVELATSALPGSSTSINSNETETRNNEDLKIKIVVEKIKNKINKTHSTTSLPTISMIKHVEPALLAKEPPNHSKPVKFTTESTKLNQTPPVKQIANKGIRSYDPDKHCGVVLEQVDELSGVKHVSEPCTRSLTCKKHPISLRRQVGGRSKTFNELFKQYRDEKLVVPNQPQMPTVTMTTNAQTSKTPNTPTQQLKPKSQSTTPVSIEKQTSARKYSKKASHLSSSQSDLFNTNKHLVNQASNLLGNVMNSYEQTTLACALSSTSKLNQTPMEVRQANACLSFNENMDNLKSLLSTNSANTNMVPNSNRLSRSPDEFNLSANKLNLNHSSSMLVKHHPRPSAVTSFNARLTDNGGGYTLWNRRQDNLRCVLTSAFNSSELFSKSSRNYTMPNNEFMQTQEHYMIEQNQNDDFNSTNQTSHSYSNGFDYHAATNTNGSSNGHKQFFTGIDQFLSPKLVNPFANHSNAYNNNHVNSHSENNIGNNNGNMFLNDHGVHYTSDSFINNEFINASSLSLSTAHAATTTSTNSSCISSTNNLAANQPMFNNHNSTSMNNGHYHLNGMTSPTINHTNLKRPYSASNQLNNSHVSHTSAFADDEYDNSYKYMKLTPSSSPIKSTLSPPTNHNHNNHHAMSHHHQNHHHHNHLFNHANANQPTHLKKFSFSLISSSPSSSSSASSSISSLLASTNNLTNNIALSNNSATNGANNQNNLLASKNV